MQKNSDTGKHRRFIFGVDERGIAVSQIDPNKTNDEGMVFYVEWKGRPTWIKLGNALIVVGNTILEEIGINKRKVAIKKHG